MRHSISFLIRSAILLPSLLILLSCGGDGDGITDTTGNVNKIEYSISGRVEGLSGSNLVIALQYGADDYDVAKINTNGEFTFKITLPDEHPYLVGVVNYPDSPEQYCRVNNESGYISKSDVTDIEIICEDTYYISGTVTGLNNDSFVITNIINGISYTDTLTISNNGLFRLNLPLLDGMSYGIQVITHPKNPPQRCVVVNGAGSIAGSAINNVSISCEDAYTVSGSVTGLTGYGLVLQNNLSDNLTVSRSYYNLPSDFTFTTPLVTSSPYNISVLTQPGSPGQTCSVVNESGVIGSSNINTVAVNCITNTFTVGGLVNGLEGSGLFINSTTAGELSINQDGSFTLPNTLDDYSHYFVSIATQPTNPPQLCSVLNGSGRLSGQNTTDITISCVTQRSIGGSVSGLDATDSFYLRISSLYQSFLVNSNGDYTLNQLLLDGSSFEVELIHVPPSKNCSIINNTGVIAGSNVNNVDVSCVMKTQTIGGTVSGLDGTGLVLQNNGGDNITINSNGDFTFDTPATYGDDYNVTLLSAPTGPDQYCSLRKNVGSNVTLDINNIIVECSSVTQLNATTLSQTVILDWPVITGTTYDVYYSSDIDFTPDSFSGYSEGTLLSNVEPPLSVTNLTNNVGYYFVLRPTSGSVASGDSDKIAARPNGIGFDGAVNALATAPGGINYIGGAFKTAGASLSNGALLSQSHNNLENSDYPDVNGVINIVIGDTVGGWFISGDFTQVGGQNRAGLAHILADGTVDPNWTPSTDKNINAMIFDNNIVYLGGDFTQVNGTDRFKLAAINLDGSLNSWSPVVSNSLNNAVVNSLALDSNIVYIAGYFSSINNTLRSHLAAVNLDGTLTDWSPSSSRVIKKILVNKQDVYIAGSYFKINGINRNDIAKITTDGVLTDLNPRLNATVSDLFYLNNKLYVSGRMFINSEHKTLVSIEPDNTVNADYPTSSFQSMLSLEGINDTLYIVGTFNELDGETRNRVAAIGADGKLKSWSPQVYGDRVNDLAIQGDSIYVGGKFSIINGISRQGLASIDSNTLTSWQPQVSGTVYTLKTSPTSVYIGGLFNWVNDISRTNLAEISYDGSLQPWSPIANAGVMTLLLDNSLIYFGGFFNMVNGVTRSHLACVGVDGALTSWHPAVSGSYLNQSVLTMLLENNTIFVGGRFLNVGGYGRSYAAAIATDGAVQSWNPGFNNNVSSMASDGTNIYLGGDFTLVTGVPRNHLVSLTQDGVLNNWNPDVANTVINDTITVNSLFYSNNLLYVGGHFDRIGLSIRNNIAAIDANGDATSWNPVLPAGGIINSIDVSSDSVLVGGSFLMGDDAIRSNLVNFNNTGDVQ